MSPQSLHLDEEKSAAPDISPGVVQGDETLVRALINPDHIQDGKLLVRAIPLTDLRQRGFSVHRLAHVTEEIVQHSIDRILARSFQGQRRESEGVSVFRANEVRGLEVDDRQAFVVIDTALQCNHGHASIYLANAPSTEGYARKLRDLLLPFLQQRIPLSGAFGCLDSGNSSAD